MMAEQKTKPTAQSADEFIDAIEDEAVRDDCRGIVKIMKKVTGEKPVMWGTSIIGFGKYHYKYESGHSGDACLTGFSPRKGKISVYIMRGFEGQKELIEKLGKIKHTNGCIYIKRLADVDTKVLGILVEKSVEYLLKKYGPMSLKA